MPVGPQHRSGGSRRSSGGSFRSSGSSRSTFGGNRSIIILGGSSGGHSNHTITDPKLLESYKRKNKASGLLGISLFLFITMLIALIVCLNMKANYSEKIKIMDSDAVFYENLINKADNDHRKKANVKWDNYYMTYDGVDYYYVEYFIFNSGTQIDGETYAQFTIADINAMGNTIDIVFDDDGYSINANWTKENAEYLYTKDKLQSYSTAVIVLIVLTIAMFVFGAFAIRNYIIVIREENVKIKSAMLEKNEQAKEKQEEEKLGKKCAYCGSRIKDGKEKCPNCGASIK